MNERQLQFRVGIFVVLAMVICAVLVFQFGDVQEIWRETYPIAIHFEEIPGLHLGCPVKQNGITIGSVEEIILDDDAGGVLVIVGIYGNHQLRSDALPQVSISLFGDSRIEFSAGRATTFIPAKSRLEGQAIMDPMQAIQRLEQTVSVTLKSFESTSREWQQVARNINGLLDSNRGNLDEVIERSVMALDSFNNTMIVATNTFADAGKTLQAASNTLSNANSLLSDPELQANLRKTASELPKIAEETRMTIASARISIEQVSTNLNTIQKATLPIAEESDLIVRKLSGSLIQLEAMLTELNQLSQVMNSKDGSLQKFATDPSLYQNLNRAAAALTALLSNAEPAVRDLKVFTDKVARHPEILGVGGALRGSTGLKDSELQPAGFNAPGK
ncbi:MlaD family protein [Planctomicrobium sp. SH668]|uniref:MlaD family protein n=1 Tax=Planctomicrobium sp. SH668 TaxID=3448126 RepID=UPI003F5C0189